MIIGEAIEPMLVYESAGKDKYADIIKRHGGSTLAEIKYDGYRVQVHKGKELSLFTRNLNTLNARVFPDVTKNLENLPAGIYDGELVGHGTSIEGFNAVKKRVRSELDNSLVEHFPLDIR